MCNRIVSGRLKRIEEGILEALTSFWFRSSLVNVSLFDIYLVCDLHFFAANLLVCDISHIILHVTIDSGRFIEIHFLLTQQFRHNSNLPTQH